MSPGCGLTLQIRPVPPTTFQALHDPAAEFMNDDPLKAVPKDMAGSTDEPQIRFGEYWIPAHQAWKKMETASVVADVIDHFNVHFPHLANQLTRSTVPVVRQRLKDVQMRVPKRNEAQDLGPVAREMLQKMSPEDVLDELAREHKQDLNLRELIAVAGDQAYLASLRREAIEYEANAILSEQTAQIWNEMSRPAPGGGLWSRGKVKTLINGQGLSALMET